VVPIASVLREFPELAESFRDEDAHAADGDIFLMLEIAARSKTSFHNTDVPRGAPVREINNPDHWRIASVSQLFRDRKNILILSYKEQEQRFNPF
jgi:hypothetical protein